MSYFQASHAASSAPITSQSPVISAPSGMNPIGLNEAAALPASDPCSFKYVNIKDRHSVTAGGVSRHGSVRSKCSHKKSNNGFRVKAKKALRAAAISFKKLLRIGSKKSNRGTFVMPSEYAKLHRSSSWRSSQRSRRQSARMTSISAPTLPDPVVTSDSKHNSTAESEHPSIIVTSPPDTTKRQSRYVVHSYSGLNMHPPSPVRKSVRTLHPAVSHVIKRPATPTTIASETELDEADGDDWSTIDSDESNLAGSTPDSSPQSSIFTGQVQPKFIIRRSGIEIQADPSAVATLINKIDGVQLTAVRSDLATLPSQLRSSVMSEGSLPFIAKSAAISMDSETQQFQVNADAKVEQHRMTTLAALEGSPAASATVAVPASQLSPLPSSLQPGRMHVRTKPVPSKNHKSTDDIDAAANVGQFYIAYTSGFNKFSPYGPSEAPTSSTKKHGKKAADPKIQVALDEAKADNTATDILPDFADRASHRAHYERIESGIFGDAPPAFADHANRNTHASVSSPPSRIPHPTSHPPTKQSQHQIKRKPVPNSANKVALPQDKPLPPATRSSIAQAPDAGADTDATDHE